MKILAITAQSWVKKLSIKVESIWYSEYSRSRVMQIFNAIKYKCESFSIAMKKAWKAHKIEFQMQVFVSKFQFIKSDGSLRVANGTQEFSKIPENKLPKFGSVDSPEIIKFFDTDIQDWRSFNASTLI